MKRPPWTAYVVGNPVVVGVLVIVGLFSIYRWWINELAAGAAFVSVALMGASLNANHRIRAYAEWKLAWDAMAGDDARSSPLRSLRARTLCVVVIAVFMEYLYANRQEPESFLALMWLSAALLLLGIYALARVLRGRRTKTTNAGESSPVVSISVGTPLMEVPPLQVAYQRLPAHCAKVLRNPSSLTRH